MEKIRIAVRKFDPFEVALQQLWDQFCIEKKLSLKAEMIPLELHDLYDETITKKGLQKGEWDIAHINTDWILDAVTINAVENLSPFISQNPPHNFPEGWHQSLLQLQQIDN